MERSVMALIFLFYDFGNHDEVVGGMRGVRKHGWAFEAGFGLIVAEDVENRIRMCGGVDRGDVKRAELLDVFEHAPELGLKRGGFFVGEFDAGQPGHIADIKIGTAHAPRLVGD